MLRILRRHRQREPQPIHSRPIGWRTGCSRPQTTSRPIPPVPRFANRKRRTTSAKP
jgi:hypothetical protein